MTARENDPHGSRGEYVWHDDEGVWCDVGTGTLGPFEHEWQAERAGARELVREVSRSVVNSRARQGQEWGADLNVALELLTDELEPDTGGSSA